MALNQQRKDHKKKTVFLTGATGFVGKHIAARVIDDGYRLTCLARSHECAEARFLRSLGAEVRVGDILNADSIAGAAEGAHAIIHLVGIIFERQGATFEEIHVKGTMNAVGAATVLGVDRYLHMSALGSRPNAGTAYHRSKWKAEEEVRASGLNYTIFRPSIIYGPGGEFINMLLRQVRLAPLVPVIGSGRYLLQPISVFDVAACYSSAIDNRKTAGQVYDLGGPQAMSYNEMIDAISGVLKKRRLKAHIPLPVIRLAAWLSEKLMPKPLLTPDQLKMLLEDSTCDISRMKEDFGFEPRPFIEGLEEML